MKNKKTKDWEKLAEDLKEAQKDPRFIEAINDFIKKTTS